MTYVLAAARRPLFLLVLLVAVLSGLRVALWLLPLGLIVYAVAVVLTARDPGFVKTSQRTAQRRKISSATFGSLIGEIDRARADIDRSAAQASGPLQRLLAGITDQADALVEQAHELASKGEIIESYLATVDRQELDREIAQIDSQIARTGDDYTLQQLRETRAALVDRRSNADALQTYTGRITAQLRNIAANLSNVLAETIRLRTADAVSADSTGNQVAQQLSDLNADMSAFQQMLDTALAQSGASSP